MIDFGLEVDRASLERAVLEGSKDFLGKLLRKNRGRAAKKAGELAGGAVRSSPEAASLLTGDLRHELGVVSPEEAIAGVAKAVQSSVVVDIVPPRVAAGSLTAGMSVMVLREDLSELEPLMSAFRFYSRNGEVDWLRWLLTSGTTIAVAGFHYKPVLSGRSRTGFGLMGSGGSWGVPREFAGVPGDNWLSRALESVGPAIADAVAEEVFGAGL